MYEYIQGASIGHRVRAMRLKAMLTNSLIIPYRPLPVSAFQDVSRDTHRHWLDHDREPPEPLSAASKDVLQSQDFTLHAAGSSEDNLNSHACGRCAGEISASTEAIQSNESLFHPACFSCSQCSCLLYNKPYYTRKGTRNKQIQGDGDRHQGQSHGQGQGQGQVQGQSQSQGRPDLLYCVDCHDESFAKRCTRCKVLFTP